MKTKKLALIKMATAPFQPRTGAHAPARLSESTRARVMAALSSDSVQRKIEDAPKPMADAGDDTPQEPAL